MSALTQTMPLQDQLLINKQKGRALLATNFYNFETLHAVLTAAQQAESSLILQLSESSLNYLGVDLAVAMAKAAISQYNVNAWLHMDHGTNVELVKRCLDAGFDSVMIDASEKSFKENVATTYEIVKYAEGYHANVEAELGYIAKLNQDQAMIYTQPEEAQTFVQSTGVNALAIAVGSAHGFYKETPELQLDLISRINESTTAALVLHGSSGIPHDQLQEAIKRGITKINLATEIKNVFMKKLKSHFQGTKEIDLRTVFPVATTEATKLVFEKLKVINFQ